MSQSKEHQQKTQTTVIRKTTRDFPAGLFSKRQSTSQNTIEDDLSSLATPPAGYAQLTLQPATRQTVVTTTTTTTISFAPLLIPKPAEPQLLTDAERARYPPYQTVPASSASRQRLYASNKLDPKVYPLARARASSLLGNFQLDLGAAEARFMTNDHVVKKEPEEEQETGQIDPWLSPTLAAQRQPVQNLMRRTSLSPTVAVRQPKGKQRAEVTPQLSQSGNTKKRPSMDNQNVSAFVEATSTSIGNGDALQQPPRKKSRIEGEAVKLPVAASPSQGSSSHARGAFFASKRQVPSPEASPTPSNASDASGSEGQDEQRLRPIAELVHTDKLRLPASPTTTASDLGRPLSRSPSPLPANLAEDVPTPAEDAENTLCEPRSPFNLVRAPSSAGQVFVHSNSGHNTVALDLGHGLDLSVLMSLPHLVNEFSNLPNNLQSHVLFNLLKRTSMPVLQLVNSIVTPALKRDYIKDLPLELAVLILSSLDSKSLCRATRVSKKWHEIVDADGRIWKRRLAVEGLWVGDGSEQQEASEIEQRIRHIRPADLFLQRWKQGVWDQEFDLRLAARSTARKLETLRTSLRATPDDIFGEHTSDMADDMTLPSPQLPSANVIPDTLRRSSNPNEHYVHPYKTIFKRRFASRRNWTKGEARRINFLGHGNNVVTCLQFNRHRIISASDDHHINVYSMQRGGLIAQLHGHEGGVWALQYVGDMLVSGSTDRTVRVWNLRTNRCTHIFLGHVSTVRCLQIMEPQNVNPDPTGPPVWEPPYPLIVTGSRDCTLRVWKLPMPDVDPDFLPNVPNSPDGAHQDALENPFHLHLMTGHKQAVRALSGSGRICVSGSYDGTVRVWDLLAAECKHVLRGHQEKVYSVVYDARRHQCASGSMDGTVRLWSTRTGECIKQLDGHASLVGLLGLSTHALVSAAADSSLRVWDPSSGRCKHTLLAHSGAITCFQQDDYKIVSGSDGNLKMWDIRTGAFTRDLLINLTGVWQVGFDERYCVAAVQRSGQSEYDSGFFIFSLPSRDKVSGLLRQ